MFHKLYKSLSATVTPTLSRSVLVEGGNAVRIDCTIFDNSGVNNCTVTLQGSNDLQNWQDVGAAPEEEVEQSAPGHYSSDAVVDFGFAYVRLHHVVDTSGTVICSTGIEIFDA